MTHPVRTTSPAGEPIVILSAGEYERLVLLAEDARDAHVADRALADHRAERSTALTAGEMGELLAAASPLAFWRRKRGLSQAALAERIGCSQPYLNQLEAGKRRGNIQTFQRLAAALKVGFADLVIDPESDDGRLSR